MRALFATALLLAFVSGGCASERNESLQPREEFHWSSQPISFCPPPEIWRREGELSGGLKGIRFVKERSVGEAITIAEVLAAGEPLKARVWTTERNGYVYVNREMVFAHGDHTFTARFIGLNESLPLFERVVATIEFPQ